MSGDKYDAAAQKWVGNGLDGGHGWAVDILRSGNVALDAIADLIRTQVEEAERPLEELRHELRLPEDSNGDQIANGVREIMAVLREALKPVEAERDRLMKCWQAAERDGLMLCAAKDKAEAENARLRSELEIACRARVRKQSELEQAQRAKYGTPCGCEAWMQTARDAEQQLAEALAQLEEVRGLQQDTLAKLEATRVFLAQSPAAPPPVLPKENRIPVVCPVCGNEAVFTTLVLGARASIVECRCGYRPAAAHSPESEKC